MYQPISTLDPLIPVLIPMMILGLLGFGMLYVEGRTKSRAIAGIICITLCVSISPFLPSALDKAGQRQEAKENNILIKYNAKYGNPVLLNDVKFDGDGGRSSAGDYFKLFYVDDSTERIKFVFDHETGEPFCSCGNIKQRASSINKVDSNSNYWVSSSIAKTLSSPE